MEYTFRTASEALPVLMADLLAADEVGSRAGRVREMLNVQITLTEPWRREILTPHRHASIKAQIAETMWVLAGRNDVEWLSHYLPRAPEFSDDGKVWRGGYGPRLRAWGEQYGDGLGYVDQLDFVIGELGSDPLSRRAVMSIWDPAIDTQPGKDIPCNDWIHFLSRLGKLHMTVAVRSNDLMWGWSGINAFEWSALQEIVARTLGIQPGPLTFNISSLHLYDRHWNRGQRIVEHGRLQEDHLSSIRFVPPNIPLDDLFARWFSVENLIRKGRRHEASIAIEAFPEPMLQSWLQVLAGQFPLPGTRLDVAVLESPKTPAEKEVDAQIDALHGAGAAAALDQAFTDGSVFSDTLAFVDYVCRLHLEKHAAYGDSWKRRGEMLGILANIARKVDRLGGGETADETSADTAIDLLVYLAKYRTWIIGDSDDPGQANRIIRDLGANLGLTHRGSVPFITDAFDQLEKVVADKGPDEQKLILVDHMLSSAFLLAQELWEDSDQYRGADHD